MFELLCSVLHVDGSSALHGQVQVIDASLKIRLAALELSLHRIALRKLNKSRHGDISRKFYYTSLPIVTHGRYTGTAVM